MPETEQVATEGTFGAMVRRAGFLCLIGAVVISQARAADTNMADAVNHTILRVCATRSNLPYSDEKGEGLENKIAGIIGAELGILVKYTWDLQGPGFIERNLNAGHCDVVLSTAQTESLTLNTNHYYRSTYTLIFRVRDSTA